MERDTMLWKYHSVYECCSAQNNFHSAVIVTWVVSFQTAQGSDLLAVWGSRSGCLRVAQCGVPDQSEMLGQGCESLPVCDCSFHSDWSTWNWEWNMGRSVHPSSWAAKLQIYFLFFLRIAKWNPCKAEECHEKYLWPGTPGCDDTGWDVAVHTHVLIWERQPAPGSCEVLADGDAAVSEMSGPRAISGDHLLENWTCAFCISLFCWSHLMCMLRCDHLRHLICLFSHHGACWPSPTLIGVLQLVMSSHLLSSCLTSFFHSTLNGRGTKQDKEELSGC